MPTSDTLEAIKKKLSRLATKYESVLLASHEPTAVNRKLQDQIDTLNARLQTMQGELEAANLARSINSGSNGEHSELKSRITEYIREIDRCIAMLDNG